MTDTPAPSTPSLDGLPGNPPRPVAWARPWSITAPLARKALRAGAWYPVVEDRRADGSIILVMRHRNVRVPARLVELRRDRPHRFTVVRTTSRSPNPVCGTPRDLGRKYAVCPASGHRIRLVGEPTHLECPGCGYRGEVGWHETG